MDSRDLATGELSFVEAHSDPTLGLGGPLSVALDPSGESLYVASFSDDGVAAWSRGGDGRLTFVEAELDGVAGVDGLDGAREVVVSPGGDHVYVAGAVEDAVAIFARDPVSSEVTFIEALSDGVGGVRGLDSVSQFSPSPGGRHVYAATHPDFTGDGWLVTFERDQATGRLNFVESHLGDGAGGFDCDAVSNDSNFTRGVALGELAFLQIFADGFESGDTSAWSITLP